MPEKPYISQGANTGDDLYAMGAFPLGIGTFNPTDIINPGDTGLFAGFEPVMEAISTPNPGGVLLEAKTASGAAPLMISDAAKNQIWSLLTNIKLVQDLHGYANPWPAGGGANKWDEEWETGNIGQDGLDRISDDAIRSKDYIPIQASTEYFVYVGTSKRLYAFYYDANKEFLERVNIGYRVTFTTNGSAAYMRFCTRDGYGDTYLNDIAINYPSTVDTYSPYSNICPITGWTGCNVYISPTPNAADATVYPCAWQDEAGTVYGGQIDIATGWMEVTMAEVDLGTLTPYKSPLNVFAYHVDCPTNGAVLCSSYKTGQPGSTPITADDKTVFTSNYIGTYYPVIIKDSDYENATVPEFNAAMQGIQLVYELATHQYYQVHATKIFTLDGVNYIWSDCGDQITVQYAAVK